jgi:hypothetical protein
MEQFRTKYIYAVGVSLDVATHSEHGQTPGATLDRDR